MGNKCFLQLLSTLINSANEFNFRNKKLIENMNKHLGLYLTIMATKYHNTENFRPKGQNIYIYIYKKQNLCLLSTKVSYVRDQ